MNDDVLASIDAARATRPKRRAVRRRSASAKGGIKTIGAAVMAGCWPLMAVGALGWFFFPGVEHRLDYPKDEVYRQIDGRLGLDTGTGYVLRDINPFPEPGSNYDYAVTLEGSGGMATAVAVGPLAYDRFDASIKIERPEDIRKADFQAIGSTAAGLIGAWTPAFLQEPVATVAGAFDARREISATAEAQTYANNLTLFRVPDADRAKLQTVDVTRVVRSSQGFTIVYEEGVAGAGYLFGGLFLLGACAWLVRRSR